MATPVETAAHLAADALRLGWYWSINQIVDRRLTRQGGRKSVRPTRPVPTQRDLLLDLGRLIQQDATAVAAGLRPPRGFLTGAIGDHLARVEAMLTDLPDTARRRMAAQHDTAQAASGDASLPDYYRQDFHFQTGGYLTEDSARLYDVQVETLFYGAAQIMRRSAFDPIAAYMHGRDQRRLGLVDVACGTGRFLRDVRLAYPALRLTGLDLSRAYLAEAESHLSGLRPATFLAANAETIPLADASQDIVTAIFLFHELPPDVRRRVTREIARVLKPGGLLVFIDSLQTGDRPGWDGLIETFPDRFHEPYFRHYTSDDLDTMFSAAGLVSTATATAFLAKMMARRRRMGSDPRV